MMFLIFCPPRIDSRDFCFISLRLHLSHNCKIEEEKMSKTFNVFFSLPFSALETSSYDLVWSFCSPNLGQFSSVPDQGQLLPVLACSAM